MFFTKYEYFMYFLVSRFFVGSGSVHILGFAGSMTGPVLITLYWLDRRGRNDTKSRWSAIVCWDIKCCFACPMFNSNTKKVLGRRWRPMFKSYIKKMLGGMMFSVGHNRKIHKGVTIPILSNIKQNAFMEMGIFIPTSWRRIKGNIHHFGTTWICNKRGDCTPLLV